MHTAASLENESESVSTADTSEGATSGLAVTTNDQGTTHTITMEHESMNAIAAAQGIQFITHNSIVI